MQTKAFVGVLIITVLFIANILYIGKKNLWFEPKNKYWTTLSTGEGLNEGTLVTFKGLKVGEVTDLSVTDDNEIKVVFSVRKSIAKKITRGTQVKIVRTMLIGDKKLEIVPATDSEVLISNKGFIPGIGMLEINDLLSGDRFQHLMPKLEKTINNVDLLLTGFAKNPELGDKLIITLDEAIMTMRGFQRSFLLKKHVKRIREEDRRNSAGK